MIPYNQEERFSERVRENKLLKKKKKKTKKKQGKEKSEVAKH